MRIESEEIDFYLFLFLNLFSTNYPKFLYPIESLEWFIYNGFSDNIHQVKIQHRVQ